MCINGLFIGSFLNVVIYRLPKMLQASWQEECQEYLKTATLAINDRKLSLAMPFSHCPHCHKTLKPWHNIPVLSYICLKGKCAYCGSKIAWRYAIIEIITAITAVYLAQRLGMSSKMFATVFFSCSLIALSCIDFAYYIIPDELSLTLLWSGLFFSLFDVFCNSQTAIIGAMTGYLIFAIIAWLFYKITGKIGLGQGDVKLLAALGSYLGWQQLPTMIILASGMGCLASCILLLSKKRQLRNIHIPFGPYLALSGWISLLWGPVLNNHLFLL
jgi:leader peptidase (prepilin peptidase)/N-methyltransferase